MRKRLLIVLPLMCLGLPAQSPPMGPPPTPPEQPRYTPEGQLMRPDNYREWIYLSSGLGMTYGPVDSASAPSSERFDNVFVTPVAYHAFLQTGSWPDKTMFALEVRNSASKGSINNGGHYQEGFAGLEIHLKDVARFPTKWAFFEFGGSQQTSKPFPPTSSCQACHAKNGAVDETFVQFYPTLIPVAQAKGTLRPKQ
ncbi:MAG: cytochrome P460 family protein [Bryobacteraceae bacterium]|jgi:hypothetical protein